MPRTPHRRACLFIPPKPIDRFQLVKLGLEAVGLSVSDRNPDPERDDLLVIWNDTPRTEGAAGAFRERGRTVMMMENGYVPRDATGEHYIAMALDGHNGTGRWFPGDGSRWARMGLTLKPWKRHGDYVTVIAQRGIGAPLAAMPEGWPTRVRQQLEAVTKCPVVIRRPPTTRPGEKPLAECLEESRAVVVWSSAVAVTALMEGVPVFLCGPSIVAWACDTDLWRIDRPSYPERLPAFESLAWAQWSESEIADGLPFRHLLDLN